MKQTKAKITYLFHSGYTVETAHHFLIFDYYRPLAETASSPSKIRRADLQCHASVYVFSSHKHRDHFDPAILEWAEPERVQYILSNDIKLGKPLPGSRFLAPYQEIRDTGLLVRTFGSTDVGVSFLVQTDGLTLFHAGDLNWWHWKEDSPAEQERASHAFHEEVAKIVDAAVPIDIAFFPVDRRLEEFYAQGATYFGNQLRPQLLLPMHFGEDYGASEAFAEKVKDFPFATAVITHRGQEIVFTFCPGQSQSNIHPDRR